MSQCWRPVIELLNLVGWIAIFVLFSIGMRGSIGPNWKELLSLLGRHRDLLICWPRFVEVWKLSPNDWILRLLN